MNDNDLKIQLPYIQKILDDELAESRYFSNSSFSNFSTCYVANCSDQVVRKMKTILTGKYQTIQKSYESINNWLGCYIGDTNSLENKIENESVGLFQTIFDNEYLNTLFNGTSSADFGTETVVSVPYSPTKIYLTDNQVDIINEFISAYNVQYQSALNAFDKKSLSDYIADNQEVYNSAEAVLTILDKSESAIGIINAYEAISSSVMKDEAGLSYIDASAIIPETGLLMKALDAFASNGTITDPSSIEQINSPETLKSLFTNLYNQRNTKETQISIVISSLKSELEKCKTELSTRYGTTSYTFSADELNKIKDVITPVLEMVGMKFDNGESNQTLSLPYTVLSSIYTFLKGLKDDKNYANIYNLFNNILADKLSLENRINEYDSLIYNCTQYSKLMKYQDIKNNSDYQEICDMYDEYIAMKLNPTLSNKFLTYSQIFTSIDERVRNDFPEETKIYAYIYIHDGKEAAELYYRDISDLINSKLGYLDAMEYIDNALKNGESIDSIINTVWTGGVDGLKTFMNGISNIFNADGLVSEDEYKQYYILSLLTQEYDKNLLLQQLNDSKISEDEYSRYNKLADMSVIFKSLLSDTYQISVSIGNMAIPIALSFIPGVGQTVGLVTMGASIFGNSYESAYQSGADPINRYTYAFLTALSEVSLEKFLGGIPGLSNLKGTTLRTIIGEGTEEFIQEYIAGGLNSVLLKQSFDLNQTSKNAIKSFIYGAITSGILQGTPIVAMKIGKNVFNVDINLLFNYIKSDSEGNLSIDSEALLNSTDPKIVEYFHTINDYLFDNTLLDSEGNLLNDYTLTDEIFKKFMVVGPSTYGARQHSSVLAQNNALYGNRKIYDFLRQKYFSNMSYRNYLEYIEKIDSVGVCSYATVMNTIYKYYAENGGASAFKTDFGYDMFMLAIDGKTPLRLYDEHLIVDLYSYMNKGKTINNDGTNIALDFSNQQFLSPNHGSGKIFTYSSEDWINAKLIESFLQSKNPNLRYNQGLLYSNNGLNPNDLKILIAQKLEKGQCIQLNVGVPKDNFFVYYGTDGNNHVMTNSGHTTTITGILKNGDLIVSSWGKRYIVKFSDIVTNRLQIEIQEQNVWR